MTEKDFRKYIQCACGHYEEVREEIRRELEELERDVGAPWVKQRLQMILRVLDNLDEI